jgi:serine phosphatase RsbU (regulator of sigma subunit)
MVDPEADPCLALCPTLATKEVRCDLNSGDVAVLYSDGVTDATNAQEEDFGKPCLSEVMQQSASRFG